jgi:hypothetical protein
LAIIKLKPGELTSMSSKIGTIENVYDDLKDLYQSGYFEFDEDMTKRELKFKRKLIELCLLITEEIGEDDDDDSADSYDRDFWGEA